MEYGGVAAAAGGGGAGLVPEGHTWLIPVPPHNRCASTNAKKRKAGEGAILFCRKSPTLGVLTGLCDKPLFAWGTAVASKLRLMIKDEAKPHILLVEDARDIREPLARYLREHSYRATTAQDAASARKVMKGAAIDLVVLDINDAGRGRLVVSALPLDPRDHARFP